MLPPVLCFSFMENIMWWTAEARGPSWRDGGFWDDGIVCYSVTLPEQQHHYCPLLSALSHYNIQLCCLTLRVAARPLCDLSEEFPHSVRADSTDKRPRSCVLVATQHLHLCHCFLDSGDQTHAVRLSGCRYAEGCFSYVRLCENVPVGLLTTRKTKKLFTDWIEHHVLNKPRCCIVGYWTCFTCQSSWLRYSTEIYGDLDDWEPLSTSSIECLFNSYIAINYKIASKEDNKLKASHNSSVYFHDISN